MTVRVAGIAGQGQRGVLVFDDKAGAVDRDVGRIIRAIPTALKVIVLIAGGEAEQIKQRANNRVVYNRGFIAAAFLGRFGEIGLEVGAAKAIAREDLLKPGEERSRCGGRGYTVALYRTA